MSLKTKISWCDSTLNLVVGCSNKCAYCYASRSSSARVFKVKFGPGGNYYVAGPRFEKTLASWNKRPWVCDICGGSTDNPRKLAGSGYYWCGKCDARSYPCAPFHRRRVFLNSLSDWLDPQWQPEWRARLLEAIRVNENLTFILLTKWPDYWGCHTCDAIGNSKHRMESLYTWLLEWHVRGKFPKNLWLFSTVTNQADLEKQVPALLQIPAAVHGLSIEPIKGYLDLSKYLPHLDWVIVGGETNTRGRKADPTNIHWIRSIVNQCRLAGKRCFVKQVGSNPCIECTCSSYRDDTENCPDCKGTGIIPFRYHHPKGADPSEWPSDLKVQQFPKV